jgi:prepilin-type N-terminal cleavage/methylation domain-containing protein
MFSKIHKRMKGEKGFTLIELLVVIIIIAILAAIAIPTFLGQRQKAQDAAAKSLVRNAMTALESAYVDARTYDPTVVDAAVLLAIEPSIVFNAAAGHVADATPSLSASSLTKDNAVDYFGTGADLTDPAAPINDTYSIATLSMSGNSFGVYRDLGSGGATTFVKTIDGNTSAGW